MQPQNWRSRNDRSTSQEGYNADYSRGRDANWDREAQNRGGWQGDEDYGMSRGGGYEQDRGNDQGRWQSGAQDWQSRGGYGDRNQNDRYQNERYQNERYQGGGYPRGNSQRGNDQGRWQGANDQGRWQGANDQGRWQGSNYQSGMEVDYRDRGSFHEMGGYGESDEGRFRGGSMQHGSRDYGRQGMHGYQGNYDYQGMTSNQGISGNQSRYGNPSDFGSQRYSQEQQGNFGRQRFSGKGPKGYTRSDERIHEAVCEMLSSGEIDASEIDVSVQNGEVTLSGTVDARRTKRQAEEMLDHISGVKDITNNLKVKTASSASAGGNGHAEKESTAHKSQSQSQSKTDKTDQTDKTESQRRNQA